MNGRILILLSLGFVLTGCFEEAKTEETSTELRIPDIAQDTSKGNSGDTSGQKLAVDNKEGLARVIEGDLEPTTDVEPSMVSTEVEVLQQVAVLMGENRMAEALAMLNENRDETTTAAFDFYAGTIYLQDGKLDDAAREFRVAVAKHNKFLRAWRSLGIIYIQESKWEQAIPVLTKVINLGGADSITYGFLGYAYSSVGDHIKAESSYRNADLLETDADRMDWKQGMATSFFRQGRYPEAVALLSTMIEKKPGEVSFWDMQASALLRMDQPMKAAENYELIDRMGKATPEHMNSLGDIYTNQELYSLGVKAYLRALDMSEDVKPDRAIRASQILVGQGKLDLAKQVIEAVRAKRGEGLKVEQRKTLLRMESRIAVAEGAGEREAAVLKEIIALDPLDGEALIILGQHEVRKENYEQAAFYYERAAGIEKFEADANVRHAQLKVKQQKYDEAVVLLRRAQQIKHRDNIQDFLEQVERAAAKSARSG